MRTSTVFLVSLIVTAACEETALDLPPKATPTTQPSDDGGWTARVTPPSGAQPASTSTPPAAAGTVDCTQRPGQRLAVGSPAELRTILTRRWVLCTEFGLGGLNRRLGEEAGMEIRPDGRYVILTRTARGTLTALSGLEYEGTIKILPTLQTNFERDLGGTVIVHPVISDAPRMLILNNNGVHEYRYIAAP